MIYDGYRCFLGGFFVGGGGGWRLDELYNSKGPIVPIMCKLSFSSAQLTPGKIQVKAKCYFP